MDTKLALIEKIDILLATFNETISLDCITSKEGKMLTICPKTQIVQYVNIWKVKKANLTDLSEITLEMIAGRLADVYNKRAQGFDK